MPGIVGMIRRQGSKDCDRHLKIMSDSIQYEDFYNTGIYVNPELSVYVGWSCHPNSFDDHMPVTNQDNDLVLIFSGEVFENRNQITPSECENQGNDAQRVVRLYEECGEQFVEKLNGLFCGLLLDLRRGKSFLFNDRYGMQRVFVHENNDGFYFSSEAKALLAALPDLRRFDPKGLGEFLTCGCTLGNRSLYKDLNILPPGALWEVERGEIKKRGSYFDIQKWIGQERLTEKEFSIRLVEMFSDLLKKYSRAGLPVGVSLTAGLDSRMVMALLDESQGRAPCYTFGSMYRDTLDVQTAREVAKVCGQPHNTLVLGEEFLRDFPWYLEKAVYISDGYLGMSAAAELYLNSLARNIAPVRITGNYGGELLRGHRAFKHSFPRGDFIRPEFQPFLHEAKKTFQELENTDSVTFALFRQAPSQGYGRMAIERSQVIPRTPFMDNDLVRLVYRAAPHLLKNDEFVLSIISRYRPDLLRIPTERGVMSGSSSIHGLLRRLYRKSLIKGEYWSSRGMPSWLARISRYGVGSFLEKRFLGRDKFQHFRVWTQKRFAGYLTDLLLQGSKEFYEFFSTHQVEKIVREHMAGERNHLDAIDKLLTLTLAHRTLFEDHAFKTGRSGRFYLHRQAIRA